MFNVTLLIDSSSVGVCWALFCRRMLGKTMEWRPSTGGSMYRTVRMVNNGLQHAGLIPGGSEVVNRPGGAHSLALNSLLNQRGDTKRIKLVNTPFITNKPTNYWA